jgi:hypothetical protein
LLREMSNVAAECFKHPREVSVLSEEDGKYHEAGELKYLRESERERTSTAKVIDPYFKLVFLTATFGTLFFFVACIVLHVATGGNPPPLLDKFIQGLFDLVKIGFGAIVGLLGGKAIGSRA